MELLFPVIPRQTIRAIVKESFQPRRGVLVCDELSKCDFHSIVSGFSKMKVPWQRLIRFECTDGRILRGEPILPAPEFDIGYVDEGHKLQAKLIIGTDIFDTTGATQVSEEIVTVKKILCPLVAEEVPILRCVGLNYAKHSEC